MESGYQRCCEWDEAQSSPSSDSVIPTLPARFLFTFLCGEFTHKTNDNKIHKDHIECSMTRSIFLSLENVHLKLIETIIVLGQASASNQKHKGSYHEKRQFQKQQQGNR